MSLIIFLSMFNLVYQKNLRKMNYDYSITITIKGKGEQQILSDEYVNYANILSGIIINNKPFQVYNDKYVNIQENDNNINNITLVWNEPLNNISGMFFNLSNITRIEFSNFDTSEIINMSYLFYECTSLEYLELNYLTSLNIDNFDTSSVTNMLGMFENSGMTSLNLSKFDTSKVISMWCMFSEDHSLIFLNLINFNTSSAEYMDCMFRNCYSLISLNINSFNTSLVKNMYELFHNCKSLISLNLQKFNIKEDVNTEKMFTGINPYLIYSIGPSFPNNLTETLSHLIGPSKNSDTCFKNVENKFIMEEIRCIDNCANDNLYKFEYNNICYKSCPKRTNIISDNTNLCKDLFCEKKDNKYYNFNQTLCISKIPIGFYLNNSIEKTIDECDIECKECNQNSNLCISCNIDNGYYPILNNTLNNNNESFINCYNNIPNGYFLDKNVYKPCYFTCEKCIGNGNETNNQCIECKENYYFISFENNSNCYKICEFYYYFDILNNYNCTLNDKCPEQYNKLIKNKKKCIDNCINDNIYKYEYNNICYESCPNSTINSLNNEFLCINETCSPLDFFLNNCKLNDKNEIDDMINNMKLAIINGDLDYLIKDIIKEKKKDLIIMNDNITFQITSSYIQQKKKSDNISIILLNDCEKKLRENNVIDDNSFMLIFKLDIKKEELLIPLVEYEVFDYNNKTQLDLSFCNKVDILFPVSNVEKDLYKHNISSEYYNDICFSYTTKDGTDIIMNDRKKEFINSNLQLCESNCNYNGYDDNINMADCECEIKIKIPLMKNIIIDKNKLSKKFKDIHNLININIMKCYNRVLTEEGLKNNIGNYILILIIMINIISMILFIIKGFASICIIIYKIGEIK